MNARRTMVCIVAGLLLVGAVFSANAQASSVSFSGGSSGIAPQTNQTLSLSQFDPAQGTLQSVKITVTGNSTGGYNVVDNASTVAGTATLAIGTNIQVTGPLSLIVLVMPNQSASGPLAAEDDPGNVPDYLGADSFRIDGTGSTDTQSQSLNNPPTDLSAYIGTGSISLIWNASNNTSSSIDVAPSDQRTGPTSFDFTATVIYTYTPEPATMAVMGIAGLVGLLRRRK